MSKGDIVVKAANVLRREIPAAISRAPAPVRARFSQFAKNMGMTALAGGAFVGGEAVVENLFSDHLDATDSNDIRVAAEAAVRAGVNPEDLISAAAIKADPKLAQMRASLNKLALELANKQVNDGDKTLSMTGDDDIAKDLLRRRRVAMALRIFGSAEAYMLVIPNGGIPPEDFAWYESVIRGF